MPSTPASNTVFLSGLRRRALAAACLCWALAVPADESVPAAALAPAIEHALRDLLQEMRARQLVPEDEAALGRTACQALLDVFATGGRVVPGETEPPSATAASAPLIAAAYPLGGRFGYLRIAGVESGLPGELSGARARLSAGNEGGMVVDLREAAGNDLDAAGECAAILGSGGLPLVAIVNGHTQGAAEVLAGRLREGQGAVLVGEATRGLPFAMRPVRLDGGLEVLLPDVPPGAKPSPLHPDVPCSGNAVRAGAEPRPWEGALPRGSTSDECLRRAVDLLTAIATFRQQHF